MRDAMGRGINYMRLSITDRCNLRCRYCMPGGVPALSHQDILSYEELLLICQAAVELGIDRFKITGGEPLVRKGCMEFIRRLKALDGVEQVTLTTNGVLLAPFVPELVDIGIDGINISLDTLDAPLYQALTGADADALPKVLEALESSVAMGIRTKVNAVLAARAFPHLADVVKLAEAMPVDVRLIELMPLGAGKGFPGVSPEEAMVMLASLYPDLHPVSQRHGNGPARYFASKMLKGAVGLIDAVSHGFCSQCNRVRLSSTGVLRPCLCYPDGIALRPLLVSDAPPGALRRTMEGCILQKPSAHCFGEGGTVSRQGYMNQIGG